jgi:hypothetical protein
VQNLPQTLILKGLGIHHRAFVVPGADAKSGLGRKPGCRFPTGPWDRQSLYSPPLPLPGALQSSQWECNGIPDFFSR